jgi:phosphoglycerate dehydrogenase-like enzyme
VQSQPNILIYHQLDPGEYVAWLQNHGCPGTVFGTSDSDESRPYLQHADVIVAWRFPSELFREAPCLRWVQSMGAGIDGVSDVLRLRADVVLTRILDVFSKPIAEFVFAEMLAQVRNLDRARSNQRSCLWGRFEPGSLEGKTIGVAGLGSIGMELVRKARAFDMRVFGLSRGSEHAHQVDRHFGPDEWLNFVPELDFLVLTLPLTSRTCGIVDSTILSAMSPDARLINVGRGKLVVESDLIDAIENKLIAGAILDVFEVEPLPAESPLWSLPGVIVSPHVSGITTPEGIGEFVLENVKRWTRGEPLMGVVDRVAGY